MQEHDQYLSLVNTKLVKFYSVHPTHVPVADMLN